MSFKKLFFVLACGFLNASLAFAGWDCPNTAYRQQVASQCRQSGKGSSCSEHRYMEKVCSPSGGQCMEVESCSVSCYCTGSSSMELDNE